MYDRILVPTDGSAEGERAVEHALELARTHGAAVLAVYVVNTAGYSGLPMETAWEGISDALWAEGEGAVDRVVTLADAYDLEVETVVLEGSPSRQIVALGTRRDCDLIVMGTHGRGGINRLLLGSVAERVVRHSSMPVLTVQVGDEPSSAGVDAGAELELESETGSETKTPLESSE